MSPTHSASDTWPAFWAPPCAYQVTVPLSHPGGTARHTEQYWSILSEDERSVAERSVGMFSHLKVRRTLHIGHCRLACESLIERVAISVLSCRFEGPFLDEPLP
jgi:hypothetical protein